MSGLTVLADAEIVRVGDVAEQVRGVSYSKEDVRTAPQPGYIPLLRGGNVREHGLSFDDLQFVPKDSVSQKQILRAGDILVVASSGSLSGVGKAACVPSGFHGTFGAFCKVIRPAGRIDASYLGHYFRTAAYRLKVSSLAGGANINNLRNEHLDGLRIRLPALDEQRRISAILDKADELRTKRRQALASLGGLTQSIFLRMFGDVTSENSRWPRTHLGDLASTGSGGTPSRAKSDNFGGTIPWIRSGDLDVDSITEAEEFITEVGLQTSSAKLIQPGAVLLAMYGATVGNSSILRIPATTNQAVCSISCGPNLDPVFLLHFLRSVKTSIVAQGVGGAQPNISQGIIRKLRVPEVPLPLQMDFAERASHVERLQGRHRMQLAELDTLFTSLQHRAFKGEL